MNFRYFITLPARISWLCLPLLLCLGSIGLESSASQGFDDRRDSALSESQPSPQLPDNADPTPDDDHYLYSLTLIRVPEAAPYLFIALQAVDTASRHTPFSARAPPSQVRPTTTNKNTTYVF